METPLQYSREEAITFLTAPGKPFELYDGEVYGRPCKVFRSTPNSLRELYESGRSDKTFIFTYCSCYEARRRVWID